MIECLQVDDSGDRILQENNHMLKEKAENRWKMEVVFLLGNFRIFPMPFTLFVRKPLEKSENFQTGILFP